MSEEIERSAIHVRREWGMGFGPIPNMVKLLESKGIIVLPIYDVCDEVDKLFNIESPGVPLHYALTWARWRKARFDASRILDIC